MNMNVVCFYFVLILTDSQYWALFINEIVVKQIGRP